MKYKKERFKYIKENKDWAVSGVGTALIILVVTLFLNWLFPPPSKIKEILPPANNEQVSVDGNGSTSNHGSQSAIIQNYYEISKEKFEKLTEELGITKTVLKSFFKIMELQQVPMKEVDSTLRKIASRYRELEERLQGFDSGDPAITELKQNAYKALKSGNFKEVESFLNEISKKE